MEAEAADINVRSLQAAAKGPDAALAAGVDSGIFLRIVRDLRRVHSHIAALAYPVLERATEAGDLDAGRARVAAAADATEKERAAATGDGR
jgi:phosphate:Na+ symporter